MIMCYALTPSVAIIDTDRMEAATNNADIITFALETPVCPKDLGILIG